MWIFGFLFFGLPILWVLKLIIIDPISDKIKDSVEKEEKSRHFGEEIITNITTFQNKNISEEDIIVLFNSQRKNYICHYYTCEHKVYSEKDKQNYAWRLKTRKNTYGWGIIYNIELYFSNGWFILKFSDSKFDSGNISSEEYYFYGCSADYKVDEELKNCMEEAKIMWKSNGREPDSYLPFNIFSIDNKSKTSSTSNNDNERKKSKTSSSNNSSNSKKKESEKTSSNETSYTPDLIAFYRNLLDLKLRFSQDELKTAYRKAVEKYHPDRYGAASLRDRENAETLMKQINEAYDTLKKYVG